MNSLENLKELLERAHNDGYCWAAFDSLAGVVEVHVNRLDKYKYAVSYKVLCTGAEYTRTFKTIVDVKRDILNEFLFEE